MLGAKRSGATVFVADHAPVAPAVLQHLIRWSAEDLIERFWWLEPFAEPISPDQVQELRGYVVETGEAREVRLLQSLAEHRFDCFRLVMINHLTAGRSGDVAVGVAVRSLPETLTPRLPQHVERLAINVLIPVSGIPLGSVPKALLHPGWTANVVVSPQDLRADDRTAPGVTEPGNYVPHAALHLASIGGLWSGVEVGPFDLVDESADGAVDPVAVRAMVRVVRCSGFVADVAEVAVRGQGVDGWELPREPEASPEAQPVVAHDPQGIIADALEQASELEGGALLFRPREGSPLPHVDGVGWLRSVGLMFSEIGLMLRGAPNRAVTDVERQAQEAGEDRSSEFNSGDGSLFASRLSSHLRDSQDDEEQSRDVNSLRREADTLLERLGRPSTAGPLPGLWRTLRQFCFASIDGAELPPPFGTPLTGARRQVITRAEHLSPDPQMPPFQLSDDLVMGGLGLSAWANRPIAACDVHSANLLDRDLSAAREWAAASAEDRTGTVRRQLERLDDERERLRSWIASRANSFLWQLTSQVDRQVLAAKDVAHRARPVVGAGLGKIDSSVPPALRKQLLRTWIILFVVALLAAVGVWFSPSLNDQPIRNSAVVVLALLVAMFFGYRRYVVAMHRWEVDARRTIHEFKQSVLDLYHASDAVVRLASIYQQLADWAEIIGWVVHRPWSDYRPSPAVARDFESEAANALVLLDVDPGQDHIQDLGQYARRDLFRCGWLGPVYEEAAAAASSRAAARQGLGSSQRLDPDLDTPYEQNGARTSLLADLRVGTPSDEQQEHMVERVGAFVTALPASEVFPELVEFDGQEVPMSVFLDTAPPAEGAKSFEATMFTSEALVNGKQNVARSELWQWEAGEHSSITRTIVGSSAPTTDSLGGYLLRTVRFDRSERTPPAAWAIFSENGSDTLVASDDEGSAW